MTRVTCKDCGRGYDYEKDDFCPKCGSYNPPPNLGATKLESELLTRFSGGQKNQARAKGQQATRQAAGLGRPGGARQQPASGYRYRSASVPAPKRDNRARSMVVWITLTVMIAVMALLAGVGYVVENGLPAMFYGETQEVQHTEDEVFTVGSFQVELDGARRIRIPEESGLYREGYELLAVDVYITGGGAVDKKTPVGDVYLLGSDGAVYAERDPLQVKRLRDLSEYAVDLGDALWEDPLLGSFVFYVEEDTGGFVLVLEDVVKAGGDIHVNTRHYVTINEPEDAWP